MGFITPLPEHLRRFKKRKTKMKKKKKKKVR